MNAPAPPALLPALERLDAMLALALAFSQSGRRLDLDGLDAEVTALCAAILTLPVPHRRTFGMALQGLQARILALQASLASMEPEPEERPCRLSPASAGAC